MTRSKVWEPGSLSWVRVLVSATRTMPNSAEYRRYAEVAQKLAKKERGSDHSMWAELALFWREVAEYTAAEVAQLAAPHRSHFRLRRRYTLKSS